MPKRKDLSLSCLVLNLNNPRTGKCHSQVESLLSIFRKNSTQFCRLADSILKRGFLGGEAILVKKGNNNKYIVEEGNRRVSVLKLLIGTGEFRPQKDWPKKLVSYSTRASVEMRRSLSKVHCLIYDETDDDREKLRAEIANRHLTGKANNAARLDWPTIYVAQEERDLYGEKSLALELMEKFFIDNPNLENEWAPDYDLTVLEDFLPHLASYLQYDTKDDLVSDYPNDETRIVIDALITDNYTKKIKEIRVLENRRSVEKARKFFEDNYPITQLGSPRTIIPKPAPPITSPTSIPVDYVTPVERVKRTTRENHDNSLLQSINELISLSNQIGETKLSQALHELQFHFHTKKKNSESYKSPISISILLRSVFDYSAQKMCTSHGISIPSKQTLGWVLAEAKKLVTDSSIRTIVELIQNKQLNALHCFVHSTDIFPPDSDMKAIYVNLHPIMKHFLEVVRDKKNTQAQKHQTTSTASTLPLPEHQGE